jgi:hypothetical protein
MAATSNTASDEFAGQVFDVRVVMSSENDLVTGQPG